ncbi:MAG: tRNA 2-thiouridine(34) synthase MnmA [Phycisphaeraceae bacterium]|nr:tRNA 2-thiouridine(34) synthase MnmA [Phycisphaeraceae bacterium]
MSGGVDSAVAAALLRDEGHEVVGCFMRLGSDDSVEAAECSPAASSGCCSLNDAADARHVAAILGVPLYVLNFKQDFGRVIDYFVREYNAGRTPNPCVRCNDWLKFGKLMEYAQSIDAPYVATGHYARIDHAHHEPRLLRGCDRTKDQSYVLFGMRRERLGRLRLPIGDYPKTEVRRMAKQFGLPVHNKPDSQEICFVPDDDYGRLVRQRSPETVRPGPLVNRDGKVLGEHAGHQHFTIGQRRGLGVATGVPLYVIQRDAATNTVVVGSRDDLHCTGFVARQTNWLTEPPSTTFSCQIKIRYNGKAVDATATLDPDGSLRATFAEPVDAVTPGQAAVCYDGDVCLGGGWIDEVVR